MTLTEWFTVPKDATVRDFFLLTIRIGITFLLIVSPFLYFKHSNIESDKIHLSCLYGTTLVRVPQVGFICIHLPVRK